MYFEVIAMLFEAQFPYCGSYRCPIDQRDEQEIGQDR